jgi:hypothetical protein
MGNNFTQTTNPTNLIVTQNFDLTIVDEFNLFGGNSYTYYLLLVTNPTQNTNYTINYSTPSSITFTGLSYNITGTIPYVLYEKPPTQSAYPLYKNYVSYTGLLDFGPVCFVKGTKILCLIDGIEQYVNVEDIKYDTLVKTYLHGYKRIKILAYSKFQNSLIENKNDIVKIFKLSINYFPELVSDLYVTGQHSILVDCLTKEQIIKTLQIWSHLLKIDDKFLLMSLANEKAEVVKDENLYELYQIVLENDCDSNRYGIYANGLLSETMSLQTFNRKKKAINLYKEN